MEDDSKMVKKLKGKYTFIMPHSFKHSLYFAAVRSHTHTQTPSMNTYWWLIFRFFSGDIKLCFSPRGSCFCLNGTLSSFRACQSFSMPSSKRYKELKLLQYCKPIISPRARLKILVQTNNGITLLRWSLQTPVPKGLIIHSYDIRRVHFLNALNPRSGEPIMTVLKYIWTALHISQSSSFHWRIVYYGFC